MSDIDTTVKDFETGVKNHDLTAFRKEVNSELIVRSSNQQHSAEYLKGLNDELHKHGFPADLEIVGADKDHVKARNNKTNEVVNLDEEVKKADPEHDQKETEKGDSKDKSEEKKISVPADTEHEVKKTETLWGIARDELAKRLGHKPSNKEVAGLVKEISEHNKLENPNLILPGQKILIPADKSVANADVPVVKPGAETPPPVVKPGAETPPPVVKPGAETPPPVVNPGAETPPVVKPTTDGPVRVSGVLPLSNEQDKPIHVGDIAAKDADEYINEYDYFFGPKVDRQRAVEGVKASMTPEAWQKLNTEQKQVSTAEMSDYLYKNFDKISDNNGVASPEKIAQAIKETNDPHEKAILMAVLLNQKEIDSMDYDLSLRTGFTFDDVKALHYEVEQQRAAIATEKKAA